MPITIINITFLSGGGIIGFIFGRLWEHFLARRRNIHAAQVSNYIQQHNIFCDQFTSAIQALADSKSSLKEIIIAEFPKHDSSRRTFLKVLSTDKKRLNRFNEKWTEYEKIANEYLNYDNNITLQNAEYFLECAKDPNFIKRLPSDIRDKFAAEFIEIEDIRKKYVKGILESLCDITNRY
jgi:hypothetical protein